MGDTTFVSMDDRFQAAALTVQEGHDMRKVPAGVESVMQTYFPGQSSAYNTINAIKPQGWGPKQPPYGNVHQLSFNSPSFQAVATAPTTSYPARVQMMRTKFPHMNLDMPSLKIDTTLTATPYSDAIQSRKSAKNDHVKRPVNAFMVWAMQRRRAIIAKNPNSNNARISEGLGHEWQHTDPAIRNLFAEEAQRLKVFHAMEFPNYKYSPQRNTTKEGMRTESGRVTKPTQRDLVKKGLSPQAKSENFPRSTTSSAKTLASALTAQSGGSDDNRGAVAVYQLQPPVQKRAKSDNGGTENARRKDCRQSSSQMVSSSLEAESRTVITQQLNNNNTANILTPVPTTGGQTGESAVTVNTVFPPNPVNPYYNQTFPLEQPVTFTPAAQQESVTPMDTQDNSTSQEHAPIPATSNFSTMSSSEVSSIASIDDIEDLRGIDTTEIENLLHPPKVSSSEVSSTTSIDDIEDLRGINIEEIDLENLYDLDLQTSSIQFDEEDLQYGLDFRSCVNVVTDADVLNVTETPPEEILSHEFFSF